MTKVVVITGASRGIGAATARLAAKEGYDVCINYASDHKAAEAVKKDCIALGVKAITVQGDVGMPADVEALFKACGESLGPVTHLVNNAGIIGHSTKLEDADPEMIRRVFDVNTLGSMLCAQQAIRRMSTNNGGNGGVIVNISSIAATLGSPGEYIHYASSKAAVDGFTIGLSKEVGCEGIRVNSIQAGTANTDIHEREGNPDRPAMVAQTAPLGRVAEPEDIANAILWLMSEKSSYATGAILRLGGGL
ncbi:MAG: SDR family oxidoreductase [Alphaproteobacteria bacterium]|nr:SDR family oxidoreductase [Rhodospirillales bacterium]MCW9045492.1 SDR family oxidoreductase [Alphaproteobacteria bacterium]